MKDLLPAWRRIRRSRNLVRRDSPSPPYTNDDPVLAKNSKMSVVRLLCHWYLLIVSGLGIRKLTHLELIRSRILVPVIVDAGLGTASDITQAFELGCDAVLLNTAVARAQDPVVRNGGCSRCHRLAHTAGRMPAKNYAEASTPLEGKAC